MMFSLEYSENAQKQLDKLESKTRERVLKSMERLRARPFAYVKKLVNCPWFSFRVGDYRLIMDIQGEKLLILVITMGHRRDIYENI